MVTTLPAEVVRRLTLAAGQELDWIEDGLGGFRVMIHTDEVQKAMDAHTDVIAEFDHVFRALTK